MAGSPASPEGTKREGARLEWVSRFSRTRKSPKVFGGLFGNRHCPLYGIGGGELSSISPPVTCLTLAFGYTT